MAAIYKAEEEEEMISPQVPMCGFERDSYMEITRESLRTDNPITDRPAKFVREIIAARDAVKSQPSDSQWDTERRSHSESSAEPRHKMVKEAAELYSRAIERWLWAMNQLSAGHGVAEFWSVPAKEFENWAGVMFSCNPMLRFQMAVMNSLNFKDLVMLLGNGNTEKGMKIAYDFFNQYSAAMWKRKIQEQWRRFSDYYSEASPCYRDDKPVVIMTAKHVIKIYEGALLEMAIRGKIDPDTQYILPFVSRRKPSWK